MVVHEFALASYASLWHAAIALFPPIAKIVLPTLVAPSPSAATGLGASIVQVPYVGVPCAGWTGMLVDRIARRASVRTVGTVLMVLYF